MNWSGKQLEALHQALLSAYPREKQLQRLLRIELEIQLNTKAGGDNYSEVV
ncbi:MAG: hypothetical protein F6J97_24045, partial [Leptolyngbya sp. SIO4C1]|nr:hypothetical protein [Leptolyngbya sp. SIO4C1]